jgi:hypothetical protein
VATSPDFDVRFGPRIDSLYSTNKERGDKKNES